MKPEKSAWLTALGVGTTFTVGFIFTLLIPSFNENWSANTAQHEWEYHSVYRINNGMLERQMGDNTWIPTGEKGDATLLAQEHDLGYTASQWRGRRVYQREGCVYCHTQQVRPLQSEMIRYSIGDSRALPADEREYVFDQPHFLGTRRIGPDLSRVGGKYSDDWHYSHFYYPRQLNPDSVMPAFTWMFTKDPDGNPVPDQDMKDLTSYVQTLGYGRLIYEPQTYKTNGGWGPWLRPADQQLYQTLAEGAVARAATPVRGGDRLSPTNRIPAIAPGTSAPGTKPPVAPAGAAH